jgi:hypothetical protein
LIRKQILSTAAVLMLAAGTTTGAMAFSHKAGGSSHHVRSIHASGVHSFGHRHRARFAGVRGSTSRRQDEAGYRGGFIDLGPLGITAACGSYRSKHYCGQGYSVSGWTY